MTFKNLPPQTYDLYAKHPIFTFRDIAARHGEDYHRNLLVNDSNDKIKETVYICGNDHHKDQLITFMLADKTNRFRLLSVINLSNNKQHIAKAKMFLM